VGVSQRHSTNIGRVLNLKTGHISDQVDYIYANHYATVSCPDGNPFEAARFDLTSRNCILKLGYERHVNIEVDERGCLIAPPALDDKWLTGPEQKLMQIERRMKQLRSNGQARA
jgi:hypothetical protein